MFTIHQSNAKNLVISKIDNWLSEVDLGLLQHPRWSVLCFLEAVNYYHKTLHLGCCSSPRSASGYSKTSKLAHRIKSNSSINPFMTEVVTIYKPVHWFLYDNGLRHERVNYVPHFYESVLSNFIYMFTLNITCISESCIGIKIKLNFYFHTSFWCLKRFYEGLHKTFLGTTKKCENKNLT